MHTVAATHPVGSVGASNVIPMMTTKYRGPLLVIPPEQLQAYCDSINKADSASAVAVDSDGGSIFLLFNAVCDSWTALFPLGSTLQ